MFRKCQLKTKFFCLVSLVSSASLQAQSKENKQADCFDQIIPGMNFIKQYKIDTDGGTKNKIEYSYVFTRGTTYTVHLCGPDDVSGRIPEISIYDGQRHKIATNKIQDKLVPAITFICGASGIFYLQYTIDGSVPYNGQSILSFSIKSKSASL